MDGLRLLILILASFRLTHLIVFDSIMEPVRSRLENLPFIGPLISCYWCCGIWVSAALLLFSMVWPGPSFPVMLILAIAGGQALLESLVQRE